MGSFYALPKLSYGYKDLEPHISEEQLTIHHQKHHQAYVTAANAVLERLDKARKAGTELDIKATFKDLSFQIGGHVLHSLFWGNLAPSKVGGGTPTGDVADVIAREYGSFDRFKAEFSQCAVGVEGSGWSALTYCKLTDRPFLMQIEKHNVNLYPMFRILMVLDVFEHAYYIDYKNARAKFVEAFWNVVNWDEVNKRLKDVLK